MRREQRGKLAPSANRGTPQEVVNFVGKIFYYLSNLYETWYTCAKEKIYVCLPRGLLTFSPYRKGVTFEVKKRKGDPREIDAVFSAFELQS